MRAYSSIIKIRFILLLQYRMAAFAGICTQFFFGIIRVMVFYAFYHSTVTKAPMTYYQAITYIWIGQATIGMLPWNGDGEIQKLIRNGNVSYELLRPINLYNHWFARAIALRTAPTMLRAIPIFFIALFLLPKEYNMLYPPTWGALLGWLVTTVGALMISCTITNMINIFTLWSLAGDGIIRLLAAIVTLCSGMIVPLPLFPEGLGKIIQILPFSGLVDVPARFYTGHIPFHHLPYYLIYQLFWMIILYALGQWILSKKLKDIIVQGG
ncbi:MAG: ABC transporter permease [Epulopiscium sp.]|nr:ABC transporter permease [Candidatus Epulonipiscium sp.]